MKVLSLIEPFATLIKEKKKLIYIRPLKERIATKGHLGVWNYEE